MTKLRSSALMACLLGFAAATACGGDDSPPANTAGKGGTGGSTGGKGGSGGSTGGKGGTSGAGGSTGGTSSGGKGGSTGGTSSGGKGGSGTGGSTGGTGTGGSGNEGGMPEGGTGNEGGGGNVSGCTIYDSAREVMDIPTDVDSNVDFGSADEMTLTSDKTWRISGRIYVPDGKTLNIDACTLIVATGKPNAGSLFVMRGGKLNAVGTPDEPIVFSSEDYHYHSNARWGGVVLLGKAPIAPTPTDITNATTPQRVFEGIEDTRATYGGDDPEDDSGTLQYARIEYGGDIIVADKEVNGLTLGGVGRGTTVNHVMIKRQGDDCIEFFGGTADVDHLICENTGDDMFDTDEGYTGHLQFLFGRLTTTGTSSDPNGFEWDGNQQWGTFTPAGVDAHGGTPHASNATLCGLGSSAGVSAHGAVLRRNFDSAGGTLVRNTIITGFDDGYDVRDDEGATTAAYFGLDHSLFFDNFKSNVAPVEVDPGNDFGFDELAFFADAANSNDTTKPAGFDCYTNPPHPFPDTTVDGAAAGDGFKTPTADYVGAFKDASDNWMTGAWVDWSSGS